jgi:transposase-like protein
MTARHSPLFTLESGQSGLGIYTSQRDAARAQDQKEIKRLKQELRRKEKALAEAAALLIASKKIQAFWGEDGDD